MKVSLLFWAIPCLFIMACNNSSKKDNITLNSQPAASYSFNRDTVFSFKSIQDTVGILQLFFSPVKAINKKIVLWKPTTDDFFNMPISDDGLCHTQIDTIIDLHNQNYIILMRTSAYRLNGKILDAHPSSPTYSIATVKAQKSQFDILNFKKNLIACGSFGNGYDTLTVEKFGKDFPLLNFSSSYVGTGTEINTNTYFELNYFEKVFEYNTYYSVGDSTQSDSNYSETNQRLIHIPGKNQEKDNIVLKGHVRYFDKPTRRMRDKDITEYYHADDFGSYKRVLQ